MQRKILLAMIVGIIILVNVWLAKVSTSVFSIPETVAKDAVEFVITNLSDPATVEKTDLDEKGLVVAVIDGDTIDVEIDGKIKRVRYIGIDTPEKHQDYDVAECFAAEATKKNETLVLGKTVRLEKDISEVDRYDRLLRYVYVCEDFVNLRLVADGYARAVVFLPDEAKSTEFKKAEAIARNSKVGLWSACAVH